MSVRAIDRLTAEIIGQVRDKVSELVAALPAEDYDAPYFQKNVIDRDVLIRMFTIQYLDDHCITNLKKEESIDARMIDKAAKNLVNSLKWRKEMGISRHTLSDFATEINAQGFFKVGISGEKQDKVTIVMDFGRHKRISSEINVMETAFFYVFTESVTIEHFDAGREVTVIFDHTNFTLMNLDSSFMLDFFSLFSTHYPTIVFKTLAYDMPWYMKPVVSVARTVLPSRITSNFFVVDSRSILQYLEKEQVPVWMGGECDCQLQEIAAAQELKETADRYGVRESDFKKLKEYYASTLQSKAGSIVPTD